MLELVLRKNGYWYAKGQDAQGNKIFESLGLPKGTPRHVAAAVLKRRNDKIAAALYHGDKATLTFREAADFYREKKGEDWFRQNPIAARQISVLIEELGDKPVAEITGADLANICTRRYPGSKPQTHKRSVYTWFNAIVRMNADAERCDFKSFKAPGAPKRRDPVMAAPESWIDDFVRAALHGTNRWGKPFKHGKRIAALVLFMTFTGARVSEAIRVYPHHLEIRGDDSVWAYFERTKNKRARFVKLHPIVVQAISHLELETGKPIFGYKSKDSVYAGLEAVCKASGLDYFSTHKFGRHAFAKRLLDEGFTLMDVKDGGGWESMTVVSENYGHLEQSRIHNAVASVRTALWSLFGDGAKLIEADKSNTSFNS